jgi:hypothetical protein
MSIYSYNNRVLSSLRNIFIALVTFAIGTSIGSDWAPKTTLEEISKDTPYYDGRMVQVESYVAFEAIGIDFSLWTLGEPFEKPEITTVLDMQKVEWTSPTISELRRQLSTNRSAERHNRARVRVIGRVRDNCNPTSGITCCFGRIVTIDVSSLTRLEEVELYSIPRLDGK